MKKAPSVRPSLPLRALPHAKVSVIRAGASFAWTDRFPSGKGGGRGTSPQPEPKNESSGSHAAFTEGSVQRAVTGHTVTCFLRRRSRL